MSKNPLKQIKILSFSILFLVVLLAQNYEADDFSIGIDNDELENIFETDYHNDSDYGSYIYDVKELLPNAIEITDNNYNYILNQKPWTLVLFHSTRCPHCREFYPTYRKIITYFTKYFKNKFENEISIASVEIYESHTNKFCDLYPVQGSPVLRIFRRGNLGNPLRYEDPMYYDKSREIIRWVVELVKPNRRRLTTSRLRRRNNSENENSSTNLKTLSPYTAKNLIKDLKFNKSKQVLLFSNRGPENDNTIPNSFKQSAKKNLGKATFVYIICDKIKKQKRNSVEVYKYLQMQRIDLDFSCENKAFSLRVSGFGRSGDLVVEDKWWFCVLFVIFWSYSAPF